MKNKMQEKNLIKIKVPFILQKSDLDCGPTALAMVLKYFGKDYKTEFLAEKSMSEKDDKGLTWTIGLAVAAKELGFNSRFFSKNIDDPEKHMNLDYFKKHATPTICTTLIKRCKELKVKLGKRILSLEELLSFVTKDSIPIVLINWYLISNQKGYNGHIVPLVGYDNKDVYIHQPNPLPKPIPYMKIPRELFDKARKSEGTDEDIVIVYRNKK